MEKIKDKKSIYAVTAWVIAIVGVLAIFMCRLPNRDLMLKINLDDGSKVEGYISSRDILAEEVSTVTIDLSTYTDLIVNGVTIYGSIKSVPLGEISFWEFANNINWDSFGGDISWTDNTVVIKQADGIKLVMDNNFRQALKPYCESRLFERFMLAEIWIAVVIILYILIDSLVNNNNQTNHKPIREIQKFIDDIKKYKEYTIYSAKADMKAEVANSYLNRLWWLLQPFFNMIVYVIVFGSLLGSGINYYSAFIFSALLMWDFFSKTVNYSVQLVRNNRDIVSRVYVPKAVILMSNMMLNMYKLAFSLIVLVPLMIFSHVKIGVAIVWVIPAFSLMILLSFGIGMLLLHFGVYIDDLAYAVGILLNMLMFLSGTFYDISSTLPSPLNAIMLVLNPVAVFLDSMRNALLYNTVTNIPQICIWFVITTVVCYLGIHIVYKNENGYIKVV